MADTKLEFTEQAIGTINAMRARCTRIAAEFGIYSKEHVEALESLCSSLVAMIGLGGRISKDAELSLYGVSFIDYGVIFHSVHVAFGERHPLLGSWSVHS